MNDFLLNPDVNSLQPLQPLDYTAEEKNYIQIRSQNISISIQNDFKKNYQAWKRRRESDPNLSMHSHTHTRKNAREYYELLNMGPRIIPLLIKELYEGDFFLLLVYELLEPNPQLRMSAKPKSMEPEQYRAFRCVRAWISHQTNQRAPGTE